MSTIATAPTVAQDVRTEGSFISDAEGPTPPLVVSSQQGVVNLNADFVDGVHAAAFATEAELATPGAVAVDWENVVNVPGAAEEINQDCAVNTGCFAGDSAGFPVTMGSQAPTSQFFLTSDLDVTGESVPEDVIAIDINKQGITLDLNGHRILGPFIPSSSADLGIGIEATSNTTIRNGRIVSVGGHGITCEVNNFTENCLIDRVVVANSGRDGIRVLRSSIIRDSLIEDSNGAGIVMGVFSTVQNSVSEGNGGIGIDAGARTHIFDSRAVGNTGDGIKIASGIVRNCTLGANGGFGIDAGTGAAIIGNNIGGGLNGGVELGDNLCGLSLCSP